MNFENASADPDWEHLMFRAAGILYKIPHELHGYLLPGCLLTECLKDLSRSARLLKAYYAAE